MGPIVAEAANRVLAEARERVGSVHELARLTEIAGEYVTAAYNVDAQLAEGRRRGQLWRSEFPDLAAALGVGR